MAQARGPAPAPARVVRRLLCRSVDGLRVDALVVWGASSDRPPGPSTGPDDDAVHAVGRRADLDRPGDGARYGQAGPPEPVLRARRIAADALAPGRPVVFLTARVHPGELPAAWLARGALEWATRPGRPSQGPDHDPRSEAFRRAFTLVVVPLLCPDGARRGHTRNDGLGQNLNRRYAAGGMGRGVVGQSPPPPRPDESSIAADAAATCPGPLAVRCLLEELSAARLGTGRLARGGLACWLDLHAHHHTRGVFCYGNAVSVPPAPASLAPEEAAAAGGGEGTESKATASASAGWGAPRDRARRARATQLAFARGCAANAGAWSISACSFTEKGMGAAAARAAARQGMGSAPSLSAHEGGGGNATSAWVAGADDDDEGGDDDGDAVGGADAAGGGKPPRVGESKAATGRVVVGRTTGCPLILTVEAHYARAPKLNGGAELPAPPRSDSRSAGGGLPSAPGGGVALSGRRPAGGTPPPSGRPLSPARPAAPGPYAPLGPPGLEGAGRGLLLTLLDLGHAAPAPSRLSKGPSSKPPSPPPPPGGLNPVSRLPSGSPFPDALALVEWCAEADARTRPWGGLKGPGSALEEPLPPEPGSRGRGSGYGGVSRGVWAMAGGGTAGPRSASVGSWAPPARGGRAGGRAGAAWPSGERHDGPPSTSVAPRRISSFRALARPVPAPVPRKTAPPVPSPRQPLPPTGSPTTAALPSTAVADGRSSPPPSPLGTPEPHTSASPSVAGPKARSLFPLATAVAVPEPHVNPLSAADPILRARLRAGTGTGGGANRGVAAAPPPDLAPLEPLSRSLRVSQEAGCSRGGGAAPLHEVVSPARASRAEPLRALVRSSRDERSGGGGCRRGRPSRCCRWGGRRLAQMGERDAMATGTFETIPVSTIPLLTLSCPVSARPET